MSACTAQPPKHRRPRQRGRGEALLLVAYAAAGLVLLGSVGTGMALSPGQGVAVHATDMRDALTER